MNDEIIRTTKNPNFLRLSQSGSSSLELCPFFGIRYLSFVISAFMKMLILTIAVIASTVFAAEEKKESTPINSSNEVAVIKTSEGNMVVQFWTDAAPNTIENFKKLARQDFYDGTIFHRIVKGFMIQGGDPNSKDAAKENSYGEGGPGYNLKAEFNDHSHDRGVISMARGPDPDSAGCNSSSASPRCTGSTINTRPLVN